MEETQNIVLPTEIKPQEIAIPARVAEEIKKLHVNLVANARAFENARAAFGEFIRITKRTLHIPEDERWEIKEDASGFVKLTEEGNLA